MPDQLPPGDDRWLTPAEVAGRLRVELPTLRGWKHRGYGPLGVKIGGGTRYRESAVAAFEAGQTAEAMAGQEQWTNQRPDLRQAS